MRIKGEGSVSYIQNLDAWIWRGFYNDLITGEKKRKKIQAKNQTILLEKVRKWKMEIDSGLSGTHIKISNWCEQWLKIIDKSVSPQTFYSYSYTVKNHIIPQWGEIKINELTSAMIQKYLLILLTKFTPGTVKTIRTQIITCLNSAVDFGYILSNPAKKTRTPKVGKTKVNALSKEQALALLDVAKSGEYFSTIHLYETGKDYLIQCNYGIVLTALTTGMRIGEILALQWSKINFKSQKVIIDCNLSRNIKKGIRISSTKTEGSNRTIPIPKITLDFLKKWTKFQKEHEEKYDGVFENPHDLVFTNLFGNFIRASDFTSQIFRKMLKYANINDERITFHSLRHTHATQLLLEGVNVKIVSERLGHSSVSTTLNIYAHSMQDMQESAVKTINAIYDKH